MSNSAKINVLCEIASYRIDELLEKLGVETRKSGKLYVGCCPVHDGDNQSAFNLYPDGHTFRGNWYCRTHGCQKIFYPTIAGLVRGVLSKQNGWDKTKPDKIVSFNKVVNWLCNFTKKKLEDIKVDDSKIEKGKFESQMASLGKEISQKIIKGYSREDIRSRLIVPSPYFLKRGFTKEVLDTFDVGEPKEDNPSSPMYKRAIVPIFDNSGIKIVGFSGRSLFDKCAKCGKWHDASLPCPTGENLLLPSYCKWRHEKFSASKVLYNYSNAIKSNTIILVEGPCDVWRLYESGITNAVAIFGTSLEDQQQILLEKSGALNIVLALDNDKAGANGIEEIKAKLKRSFKVHVPKLETKDFGETPIEVIKNSEIARYSK